MNPKYFKTRNSIYSLKLVAIMQLHLLVKKNGVRGGCQRQCYKIAEPNVVELSHLRVVYYMKYQSFIYFYVILPHFSFPHVFLCSFWVRDIDFVANGEFDQRVRPIGLYEG